jgi:hypothetical protein
VTAGILTLGSVSVMTNRRRHQAFGLLVIGSLACSKGLQWSDPPGTNPDGAPDTAGAAEADPSTDALGEVSADIPTDGSVPDPPADSSAESPSDGFADAATGASANDASDAFAGDPEDADGPTETSAEDATDGSVVHDPPATFVGTFGPGRSASMTFEAQVGQSVVIRAVAPLPAGFELGLAVDDPGGQNLGSGAGQHVATFSFRAHTTGTYTLTLFDASHAAHSIGESFAVYLVIAPGTDTGGALAPGGMVAAHLDEGALDSYTFEAEVGQGIALRMTDIAGGPLAPKITVYDPLGAVAASATATDVAAVAFQAQLSGAYTVVLGDSSPDLTAAGDYDLYFTIAPGADKGGALAPGGMVAAHLDEGALDSYTFAANAGQTIVLQMTDLAGGPLAPRITVYDPTGAIAATGKANDVAAVTFQAPSNGTYTVVLADSSDGFVATGDYELYFIAAPGANKGGALAPGGMVAAHLDEGALDSYTFAAKAFQTFMLRMVDVADGPLAPAITVYDPTGALVTTAVADDVAGVDSWGELDGTYTVVLGDSSPGLTASGDYDLYFTIVPGTDTNGSLGGGGVTARIDIGALVSYVFDANVGDAIAIGIASVSGSLVPAFEVDDPTGQVVSVGTMMSSSSFHALSKGTYTVVLSDASSSRAGTGDCTLTFSLTPASPN